MAPILGMGPGLFILVVFWILSLVIFFMTVRSVGSARHLGTGAIIGSTLLTLILLSIPREPQIPVVPVDVVEYNNMDLYRSLIIVFCGLSAISGFFYYFASQLMEPIFTMPYTRIGKSIH